MQNKNRLTFRQANSWWCIQLHRGVISSHWRTDTCALATLKASEGPKYLSRLWRPAQFEYVFQTGQLVQLCWLGDYYYSNRRPVTIMVLSLPVSGSCKSVTTYVSDTQWCCAEHNICLITPVVLSYVMERYVALVESNRKNIFPHRQKRLCFALHCLLGGNSLIFLYFV